MQAPSFPRQNARTRGFTAGAPRSFVVSPDGARVLFLRSLSGTDPVGRLWILDTTTGFEALIADPVALHGGAEELPAQEKARRERMRETSSGIVAFSTDRAMTRVAFAFSGDLYVVDVDGATPPRRLDVQGPVVDPRLSPDAGHVAFVSGRSLRVVDVDGVHERSLAEPAHGLETCGLVDFAAAEELRRSRGFWWAPDSSLLLVERVDESALQQWWVADPVHPERAPVAHRYPQAGTDHAAVTLELVALDGSRTPVTWDATAYPYVVDVAWQPGRDALALVMTRDSRDQAALSVHPRTGETQVLAQVHDDAWLDPAPGATRWSPQGWLLTRRPDRTSDTDRLHLDDAWLSPAGLQVRDVVHVDDDGVLVTVAHDQDVCALVRVGWDGSTDAVGPQDGWTTGTAGAGTTVLTTRTLTSYATQHLVVTAQGTRAVTSHAEQLEGVPAVTLIETGPRLVRTAVLFPRGHVPGSRRLPVLLSPYAGPTAQRVVRSGLNFGSAQWFADQGFAVVVADGRGTPGRGPAWERAVLRDLATPVLEDQLAALDAVLARWPDDLDPTRVGIRGWSFGGYLAALAVLRRPDRFHAAVAGAPVTDWRLYDAPYTERYLGDPREDATPYDACGLIPLAPGLARPLLLIHGMTDDNVVVAHTLALSGALTAAGRPHQVLPLSGVTHMTPQEDVAENRLLLEMDFLVAALAPDPPA